MAKKQTRRSISVSRTTYERLKAFCEANNVSMSQLVETRVNDFLGDGVATTITPTSGVPLPGRVGPGPTQAAPRSPSGPTTSTGPKSETMGSGSGRPSSPAIPMTSAAARFVVDPPPPIIKPKQETAAPKPAEKRPDQIFTF